MKERESNPLIPLCVILTVLLLGIIVLSVIMWLGKAKAEKEAFEFKTLYEELIEKTKKAEKTEKEYQDAYNTLVSSMLEDAATAENMGNLIVKVWHNAIWNTVDAETDKYTMKNGKFVTDFNDALAALFTDEEFGKNCSDLAANQAQIMKQMRNMVNPPEGYENAFTALESMYNSYITFTNTVLNCNGSLESFSNDFGEADEDLMHKYHSAELYMK